jgi:hypothetical protein
MDLAARKTFISLCLASLLIAGCAANRVALEGSGTSGTVEVLVRTIGYDDKGLPVIGPALAERPSRYGDHFSVVRLAEGKPVISYDIVVTRRKANFMKPFQTVYEWTGKGFMLGANVTGVLVYGAAQVQPPQHNDEAAIELAIVFTPLVIGTVGGFAVGLADGIRQTALELGKVVTNGEQAITCTTYEYDAMNRLWFMHMLTPDRSRELVRTEFVYEGAGTRPSRTVVKSLVEGKEREIK